MGASFFQVGITSKTAADGYKKLVADASKQYGDDEYNGTIATTSGFRVVKSMTVQEFVKLAEESTDKWGDCLAMQYEGRWLFAGWAAE
jgi:hypothetical protein